MMARKGRQRSTCSVSRTTGASHAPGSGAFEGGEGGPRETASDARSGGSLNGAKRIYTIRSSRSELYSGESCSGSSSASRCRAHGLFIRTPCDQRTRDTKSRMREIRTSGSVGGRRGDPAVDPTDEVCSAKTRPGARPVLWARHVEPPRVSRRLPELGASVPTIPASVPRVLVDDEAAGRIAENLLRGLSTPSGRVRVGYNLRCDEAPDER